MRERGERGALDEGRRGEVFRHIRSVEQEYSGGGDNMGRRKPLPLSTGVGELDNEALSDGRIFKRFDRPEHAGSGSQVRGLPADGDDAVKIRRGNLLPDLIEAGNIKDINANVINAGTLPNARLDGSVVKGNAQGKVRAAQDIDWGEGRPVPSGKVASGYDYNDLDKRPDLGKFLTRDDFTKDGRLKKK